MSPLKKTCWFLSRDFNLLELVEDELYCWHRFGSHASALSPRAWKLQSPTLISMPPRPRRRTLRCLAPAKTRPDNRLVLGW